MIMTALLCGIVPVLFLIRFSGFSQDDYEVVEQLVNQIIKVHYLPNFIFVVNFFVGEAAV